MNLAIKLLLGFVTFSEAKLGFRSLNSNKIGERATYKSNLINFEAEDVRTDEETCDPANVAETCGEIKNGGACIKFTLKQGGNIYDSEWDMDVGEVWWGCIDSTMKNWLESLPGKRATKTFNEYDEQKMWWAKDRENREFFTKDDLKECPALLKFTGSFEEYVKGAKDMCEWDSVTDHLKDTIVEADLASGDGTKSNLINFEAEDVRTDEETCDPANVAETCGEIKNGGACIKFTLKQGGNIYDSEWDMDVGEVWWGCIDSTMKNWLESLPGKRATKTFNEYDEQKMWWAKDRENREFFTKDDLKECPALLKFTGSFEEYVKGAKDMCEWDSVTDHLKDTIVEADLASGDGNLMELIKMKKNLLKELINLTQGEDEGDKEANDQGIFGGLFMQF